MEDADAALRCRGVSVDYERAPCARRSRPRGRPRRGRGRARAFGAGKTTLLYCDRGIPSRVWCRFEIDGRVVATPKRTQPPERRAVGMVFQHYALWPHMTAVEIVAYPARRAGAGRTEARASAMELLDRLGISRPRRPSAGRAVRRGAAAGGPGARAERRTRDCICSTSRPPISTAPCGLSSAKRWRLGVGTRASPAWWPPMMQRRRSPSRTRGPAAGRCMAQGARPRDVYERPVDLWARSSPVLRRPHRRRGGRRQRLAQAHDRGDDRRRGRGSGAREGASNREPADVLIRPDWAILGGPLPGIVRGDSIRRPAHRLHVGHRCRIGHRA